MHKPYTTRGKCGNWVWQRNRYGQICYPAFVPLNPRTPQQVAVRGVLAAVSARWRRLTPEQRAIWILAALSVRCRNGFSRGYPISSFNFFVKVNVALAHRGLAQVDLPPANLGSHQQAVSGPPVAHCGRRGRGSGARAARPFRAGRGSGSEARAARPYHPPVNIVPTAVTPVWVAFQASVGGGGMLEPVLEEPQKRSS